MHEVTLTFYYVRCDSAYGERRADVGADNPLIRGSVGDGISWTALALEAGKSRQDGSALRTARAERGTELKIVRLTQQLTAERLWDTNTGSIPA